MVRKVQKHFVRTYVKYIGLSAVREDRKLHKTAKAKDGPRSKKRGRPFMDPAEKGHRVRSCGQKQYCDKCGRSTGAKRKHAFWIANPCQELDTHRRSKERGHSFVFSGTAWTCKECGLKGKSLSRNECKGSNRDGGPELKKRRRSGITKPD